ncbi:uncharacterized protein fs(1)Ya isoform X3 [Tenebrio molitor]|uniref:uncharacterized protein fs(1)Ya isoform X3 n=1 Tax=Tenebrio molitor TaxID=7067 RepID=UPI0036249B36
MEDFQENCCRLCSKVFCCKNCRALHEQNAHNVNPDCEICIYGRTTIKNVSVEMLSHIKSRHWPLHCVFCKQIFNSLDELVPHNKCSIKQEHFKMQVGTPKTPVTPLMEKEEPSPEVTPFYKSIIPGTQQNGAAMTIGATSTPLVHKEEMSKHDKITPINQSEIKCIQKSSLKLTGSANLSDSKKSERRVTFSLSPSIPEPSKNPKYLPLTEESDAEKEASELTDEFYVSADEEIFKTAPNTSNIDDEEKENMSNIFPTCENKRDSDGALWESALTKLDLNASKAAAIALLSIDPAEATDNKTNFNVSLQVNILNNSTNIHHASNLNHTDDAPVNTSTNLWSSMTSMVRCFIPHF